MYKNIASDMKMRLYSKLPPSDNLRKFCDLYGFELTSEDNYENKHYISIYQDIPIPISLLYCIYVNPDLGIIITHDDDIAIMYHGEDEESFQADYDDIKDRITYSGLNIILRCHEYRSTINEKFATDSLSNVLPEKMGLVKKHYMYEGDFLDNVMLPLMLIYIERNGGHEYQSSLIPRDKIRALFSNTYFEEHIWCENAASDLYRMNYKPKFELICNKCHPRLVLHGDHEDHTRYIDEEDEIFIKHVNVQSEIKHSKLV